MSELMKHLDAIAPECEAAQRALVEERLAEAQRKHDRMCCGDAVPSDKRIV